MAFHKTHKFFHYLNYQDFLGKVVVCFQLISCRQAMTQGERALTILLFNP